MFSNLIWCGCIMLEVAILLRGALTGLLKRYPLFYSYIASVLVKEIIGLLTAFSSKPQTYAVFYWPAELATILASYGVILEIFRWSARHQPGIRRFTQNALLTVFALAASFATSDFLHGGFNSLARAIADLGRDLRDIEAAILLVLLWLLVRYRILLSRNLQGLLIGYSFWIGINVVNLAFWFQRGNESSILLRALLPVTYLMTLGIWSAALWSPYPEPVRPSETALERDYALLAAKTQRVLARASALFIRMMRP